MCEDSWRKPESSDFSFSYSLHSYRLRQIKSRAIIIYGSHDCNKTYLDNSSLENNWNCSRKRNWMTTWMWQFYSLNFIWTWCGIHIKRDTLLNQHSSNRKDTLSLFTPSAAIVLALVSSVLPDPTNSNGHTSRMAGGRTDGWIAQNIHSLNSSGPHTIPSKTTSLHLHWHRARKNFISQMIPPGPTMPSIRAYVRPSVRLPMASQHNEEGSVTITNEEIISTKYDTMTIRRIVMRYVSTRVVLYTIWWHRTRAVIEFHDCLKW